jgi:hypothetical protein
MEITIIKRAAIPYFTMVDDETADRIDMGFHLIKWNV